MTNRVLSITELSEVKCLHGGGVSSTTTFSTFSTFSAFSTFVVTVHAQNRE